MMASRASRELLGGGSGRPIAMSTALLGMTLLLIYLIILFPRPFLFTTSSGATISRDEAVQVDLSQKAGATIQKRKELENDYKYLNDTYNRQQIPLYNLPYLYKLDFKLFVPYKEELDYGDRNWTTDGYCAVYFSVQKTNQRVQLHAQNLHIGEVYIQDDLGRNISVIEISRFYPHILDIHTEAELIENMNYSVHIHFVGKVQICKRCGGLHRAQYEDEGKTKYLTATHCQTQYARTIFPCLDIPEAKAKFLVTITHPFGTTAAANARENGHKRVGNWITTTFELSPYMSTYLFAMAISDFPFIESFYRNIRIRLYASKNKIADAQLALDTVSIIIIKMEEYFGISIPLSKLGRFAK